MLKNYLKIALRNLSKQKTFSLINIFGLAVGLTVAILVFLNVHDEFKFDSFNKNADKIFRVVQTSKIGLNEGSYSRISNLWSDKIKSGIPEINASTRYWATTGSIKINNDVFEEKISFADTSFLSMFTFPLLEGRVNNILYDKSSVIITKETAEKYFGNIDPIGKTLSLKYSDAERDFIIRGVAENPPQNSSIRFSILLPFRDCLNTREMKISSGVGMEPQFSPAFFVEINNTVQKKIVEDKITELLKEFTAKTNIPQTVFHLQPLSSIHWDSNYDSSLIPTGNINNLYILILLVILTLFLVSANFVNLSIARSTHRFKEIGMRKIMGSNRKHLIIQFLVESTLLTLFSLFAAIVLSELLLPSFNNIIGKNLKFDYTTNVVNILSILAVALIVGIAAGSYPAFYMSSLKPGSILKGEQKIGGSNLFTRILVISQFVISIFLIVSAIIISGQNSFMLNKNLGFNYNNILVLSGNNFKDKKTFQLYKNEISKLNFVNSATVTSDLPGKTPPVMNVFAFKDKNEPANYFHVDYDYLNTLGLKLNKGRWFSKKYPGDYENGIVVNQSFINAFNITNPVDKIIVYRMMKNIDKKIIGVINDYNFLDLRQKTRPLVLMLNGGGNGMQFYMFIKLKSKINGNNMLTLRQTWNKVAGFRSFDPFYLSSFIDEQYLPERRWNDIVRDLSIITILIACLGLFGLVNYSTERRTKEIGIRKVMGASVIDVLKLILKELVFLISISIIIALPLSFYIMKNWLNNFAYKINIGWEIFAVVVLMVLVLTLITVGYQTIKSALANPIESLRNE